MSLKLHLCCGNVHINGYVNIDIRPMGSVDVVDNIKYLRSFKKNRMLMHLNVEGTK